MFLSAYTDNEFDVAVLMEEAESKAQALERNADLEDELGRANERIQELEVSHRFKLTKKDVYFQVDFDHFGIERCFLCSLGSSENWLKPKTKPS